MHFSAFLAKRIKKHKNDRPNNRYLAPKMIDRPAWVCFCFGRSLEKRSKTQENKHKKKQGARLVDSSKVNQMHVEVNGFCFEAPCPPPPPQTRRATAPTQGF
jgi:hypothetical protein